VVDAVLDGLADAEHHGRGGSHAELVRGAMHLQPIGGEAFQARDFVADFVVENFRAAAGNRIESGIAQARNRIAQAQIAVFGDRQNLRSGVAVQVNLREALLDAAQHLSCQSILRSGCSPPCISTPVPPSSTVSRIFS
jgi:hypothetical protein